MEYFKIVYFLNCQKVVIKFYISILNNQNFTLVDSDALASAIYAVVEAETGVSKAQLEDRQRQLEAKSEGTLIDMWQVIEELAPKTLSFVVLFATIIEKVQPGKDQFFLPGAPELLALLNKNKAEFGIVSRGGEFWQKLKFACAGLDTTPHIITGTHDKSIEFYNQWHDHETEEFLIPAELTHYDKPLFANNLVVIDDRAAVFADVILHVDGYWVQTGRNKDGNVAQNVRTCRDLTEVVPDLKAKYFAVA